MKGSKTQKEEAVNSSWGGSVWERSRVIRTIPRLIAACSGYV